MRLALAAHVQAGKALKHVSDRSGVARATLLEWLSRGTPPETVAKGAAVMEALDDDANARGKMGGASPSNRQGISSNNPSDQNR
jgi:hypothetical protein